MTVPDRMLRQYLAEALDPPDRERVERSLAEDPELRRRLERMLRDTLAAQMIEASDEEIPTGWFLPPPAAATRRPHDKLVLRGTASPSAVMHHGPERIGWVVLRFDLAPEHLDHRVVVLERSQDLWEVVLPTTPEEILTAGSLPQKDGQARLDLTAGEGPQRFAVILLPEGWPIDFDAPPEARWQAVREALAEGRLPAASFDLGGR